MSRVVRTSKTNRTNVWLTNEDRKLCYEIARKRNERYGERAGTNPGADAMGNSHIEANFVGVIGELAVCKALDIPVEKIKVHPGHGDDGTDLYYLGKTVQVKTTRSENPSLQMYSHYRRSSDLYLLVRYRPKDLAQIVGYATARDVRNTPWEAGRYHQPSTGESYNVQSIRAHQLRTFNPPKPDYGAWNEYPETVEGWLDVFRDLTLD